MAATFERHGAIERVAQLRFSAMFFKQTRPATIMGDMLKPSLLKQHPRRTLIDYDLICVRTNHLRCFDHRADEGWQPPRR